MDDRGQWHSLPDNDEPKSVPPPWAKVMLAIGEIVEIKGERFKVRKITRKDVILRSVRAA